MRKSQKASLRKLCFCEISNLHLMKFSASVSAKRPRGFLELWFLKNCLNYCNEIQNILPEQHKTGPLQPKAAALRRS